MEQQLLNQLKQINIRNQERKEKQNLRLLKSRYGSCKYYADSYESQILNPEQIQEIIQKQNDKIQLKDTVISQCKLELQNLHDALFLKYDEVHQFKDFIILKLYEELVTIQAQCSQLSLVQSEYTQTTVVTQQIITHHSYNEDQKKEALARLIRDGNLSYKQQLKLNDKLPSIRTLMKFRKQIENSKLSSQNEQVINLTLKNQENQNFIPVEPRQDPGLQRQDD
ncbi:Hypothetical_protein [Hexamita inflata]|uniref:Hypothetical_protein n=1 Tax=Hexamita inflata TaxID=28002 RepID=A0AA86R2P9_9EUKA|nr:Hypothetical protein HINF_LOCUS52747 [Hexamita inflata]